jgi:hypothetical protein
VVTAVDVGRFRRMEGDVVTIDLSAYYLREIDRVLVGLRAMTAPETLPVDPVSTDAPCVSPLPRAWRETPSRRGLTPPDAFKPRDPSP